MHGLSRRNAFYFAELRKERVRKVMNTFNLE
jgi:hypothetical protein